MSRIEIVFNDLDELSESMKNINLKIDKIKELMNNGFTDARQDQLYRNGFNKIESFLKNINNSFNSTDKLIKEYNDEFRNIENTFSNKFGNINTPVIEKKEKVLVEIPESSIKYDIWKRDGRERKNFLRDMSSSRDRDISTVTFDFSNKDIEKRKMYDMSKKQQFEDESRRIRQFPEYEMNQQGARNFDNHRRYDYSMTGNVINNPRNSNENNRFYNNTNQFREEDDYR